MIHVRLEGPLAKLLTKVDPELYSKFLTKEGGKDVMYVRLAKALYGTLQAAMLFWKDLTQFLVKEQGFELNPYDECVANKVIDGAQCTVLWHVDDLKLSHVSQQVLDGLVDLMNQKYGKLAPLTVTKGNVHDYLGMTLDFGTPRKVIVRMDDYVESVLEEAPDDLGNGTAVTLAADHLFTVSEDSDCLGDAKPEQAKELMVEYCPTKEMLADMFTKPLQGSAFRKFRDAVMNIQTDLSRPASLAGPQECVEERAMPRQN